jgi:hypothetical protein
MPPSNLPTSSTKITHVIAWWTTLLIMEDGGCTWLFPKVTNPNIIEAATKSPRITHPTKLKRLYRRLGTKNNCMIKETNWINLIYLTHGCGWSWHDLQECKGNSSFEVMWGSQHFSIGFIEVSPKLPKDYGSWALALILWVDPSPKKLNWGALVPAII